MDGGNHLIPEIRKMVEDGLAVAVCPEVLGGLPTPRDPSEILDGRVVCCAGRDVTAEFMRGAEEAMRICRENGCTSAIMKAKSPSCGCRTIHNGKFDGGLVPGNGIFTQMLLDAGIHVMTEKEFLNEHSSMY